MRFVRKFPNDRCLKKVPEIAITTSMKVISIDIAFESESLQGLFLHFLFRTHVNIQNEYL